MIEICFEEKNDAMHVYRQLLKRAEVLYKETSVYLQEQKVVIHIPVRESNYIEKILLPVMVYFIVNVKQNEWIYTILKEKFFYEEQEECHQILHMAHEILKGRRKGVAQDLTRNAFESCVHLIFDESFIFYDDKGRRLKQEKLVQYIDEELLKQNDVYIDTKVIAPLLSISPKKIYLYTKEQDHNMIITLRNVFQERVQLHGLHDFERNVKNLKNKGNALDFLSF